MGGRRRGRTGVNHALIVKQFVGPVSGSSCAFVEVVAVLIELTLRPDSNCSQVSKTDNEREHIGMNDQEAEMGGGQR